ncbi:MAG: hypothetical protein HYU64_09590 [Armatimonadetes bacterium]|nr:hypothetical protein [Armatimonadota bacterium]
MSRAEVVSENQGSQDRERNRQFLAVLERLKQGGMLAPQIFVEGEEGLHPAAAPELLLLACERPDVSGDALPIHLSSVSDLSLLKARDYMRETGGPGTFSDEDCFKALENLKAVAWGGDGWLPTLGGLLLFGKSPQQYVPSARVSVTRYKGGHIGRPVADKWLVQGTLFEIIEEVAYLVSQIKGYPLGSLRSFVAAIVGYRNYLLAADFVRVRIFDDRVEWECPGTLFALEEEWWDWMAGQCHVVLSAMAGRSLVEKSPAFSRDRVVQRLPGCRWWADEGRLCQILQDPNRENKPEQASEEMQSLNYRQVQALETWREKKYVTSKEYAEFNAVSIDTASRDLQDLESKGFLRSVGKRKGKGYFYL